MRSTAELCAAVDNANDLGSDSVSRGRRKLGAAANEVALERMATETEGEGDDDDGGVAIDVEG
jgi:hypothetical protein